MHFSARSVCLVAAVAFSSTSASSQEIADRIYLGGPIVTMNDTAPSAEAVAVKEGRILAVGDGLATDIAGANGQNIDALLVVGDGGIHDGAADEAAIAARLKEANVHALAAAEGLKW